VLDGLKALGRSLGREVGAHRLVLLALRLVPAQIVDQCRREATAA